MNGLGGRAEGGGENSVTSCCRGWEELNIENKTRDNDKWLEAGPCPSVPPKVARLSIDQDSDKDTDYGAWDNLTKWDVLMPDGWK